MVIRPRLMRLGVPVLALVVAGAAGCGYSARDEYYAVESIRVRAVEGDGMQIAVSTEKRLFSPLARGMHFDDTPIVAAANPEP